MPELTKARLVTFNICGIKGILSRCAQWVPDKSFNSMFNALGGDILCFQETKIQFSDITREMTIIPEFNAYFACSTGKKGYSGVVFYVRDTIRVLYAEEGLTGWLKASTTAKHYREWGHFPCEIYPETISPQEAKTIDEQGRVLTLDIGACVVIGVYCPANSQGNMQDYRDKFFDILDWRVHKLQEAGRKVIIMGDLNVAREPRDSAPIRLDMLKANIEIDQNEWMYGSVARAAVNTWITKEGFQDTVRNHNPERSSMFTCWDQSKNYRTSNFGSRIDYILASPQLVCKGANIMPELVGSDHCPVFADFELEDIHAQGSHTLPILAKNLKNRWPLQIQSFFLKKNTSPDPKPAVLIPAVSLGRVQKNVSRSTITKPVRQKTVADMFVRQYTRRERGNKLDEQHTVQNEEVSSDRHGGLDLDQEEDSKFPRKTRI